MSTLLDMSSDIRGYNAYAPPFATDNWQTTLAAGVAQTVTVPSNFANWIAVFSYEPGSDVFVANNVAAVAPTSSFALVASQFNPAARFVKGGDVLSFITPDTTAYVSVSFYAIGSALM